MRNDIVPGAPFPDYELTDHTATRRKLSELQGTDPMIVVLSRGAFCPKDRRQAEGLVQLHREMEVGYCRLVTISTDSLTETNECRSGVGAHWPFLSDTRRVVQKDLDIAEYTDPLHNPMIPHVVVLEPDLVIHKIYNGVLVLWKADHGGLAPGFARGHPKMQAGLGHYSARNETCVAGRPQGIVLPVRQDIRPNDSRAGLILLGVSLYFISCSGTKAVEAETKTSG